jgi:hypothetical protein
MTFAPLAPGLRGQHSTNDQQADRHQKPSGGPEDELWKFLGVVPNALKRKYEPDQSGDNANLTQ